MVCRRENGISVMIIYAELKFDLKYALDLEVKCDVFDVELGNEA
jgi:hypothetical protein